MNGRRVVVRLVAALGVAALVAAVHAGPARAAGPAPKTAQTTVDGVQLTVTSGFLPSPVFVSSQPGASTQAATSSAPPSQSLTITAIPFGTKAGAESLPVASTSAPSTYQQDLRNERVAEHGSPGLAPSATILGDVATGQISTPVIPLGVGNQTAVVLEWVATVGQRVWLVRATTSLATAGTEQAFADQLKGLVISAPDPNASSTVPGAAGGPPRGSSMQQSPGGTSPGVHEATAASARTVPTSQASATTPLNGIATPPWWSGDCDAQNYAATGMSSYPLGAGYLGMEACGPRPLFGGTDNLIYFAPGAWGVYEWECVELAMRYLYTGYGVAPYSANGNQVVANYSGTQFQKIVDGTPNRAPVPGDVLSYGPSTTFGHTSIVTGAWVDGNGNGSIAVVEENNSPGGASILQVSSWTVQAFEPVSGWLHPLTGMGGLSDPTLPDASAVSWAAGRADVFARGSDGSLKHRWVLGTASGPWESLGGQVVASMSAVAWSANRLDIFVRGTNGALWHQSWTGSGWGGWQDLGGALSSDPVAVSWGPGRLDVFATGFDGVLWHIGFDGTWWYPWQSTGAVVVGEPAVVSAGSGRIDIFGRGTGNDVRWTSYGPAGWSPWTSIGGYITADPTAVVAGSGQEDVFVRGGDNGAWYAAGSGTSWTSWQPLGGISVGAVLGLSPAPGSLDAFVAGQDHGLWQNPLTGWYGRGGSVYTDPVGTSMGDGSMYIVTENVNSVWSADSVSATSIASSNLGTP